MNFFFKKVTSSFGISIIHKYIHKYINIKYSMNIRPSSDVIQQQSKLIERQRRASTDLKQQRNQFWDDNSELPQSGLKVSYPQQKILLSSNLHEEGLTKLYQEKHQKRREIQSGSPKTISAKNKLENQEQEQNKKYQEFLPYEEPNFRKILSSSNHSQVILNLQNQQIENHREERKKDSFTWNQDYLEESNTYKSKNSLNKSAPGQSKNKEMKPIKPLQRVNKSEKKKKKSQNKEDTAKNIIQLTKSIQLKVRQWSKQQKQMDKRRQLYLEKEKVRKHEKQIKKKNAELKQIERKKEQRKNKIQQNLKNMNEKRRKRQQLLQKAFNQKSESLKNINYLKQRNKLKSHSVKRLQQYEIKVLSELKEQEIRTNRNKFNIYFNRDELEKRKNFEKEFRRKAFNEKIRDIPLVINEEKRYKMLISIDKNSNPLKYELYNRRGLSDIQIYQQAKKLVVEKDGKKIGNKYLQDFKNANKGEHLKLAKQSSISILWSAPHSEKNIFTNLHKNEKQKKTQKHILYNNDLDALLYYKAKKKERNEKKKDLLRQDNQYIKKLIKDK